VLSGEARKLLLYDGKKLSSRGNQDSLVSHEVRGPLDSPLKKALSIQERGKLLGVVGGGEGPESLTTPTGEHDNEQAIHVPPQAKVK